MSKAQWLAFAERVPFYRAREKARSLGIQVTWDCEHAKTPDGYYQVRGGIDYAIAKSLAAAPFADLLWMETRRQGGARGDDRRAPGDRAAQTGGRGSPPRVRATSLGESCVSRRLRSRRTGAREFSGLPAAARRAPWSRHEPGASPLATPVSPLRRRHVDRRRAR